MNCKNCKAEVNSNFCPNCGQPAVLKRIDGHYFLHEFEHMVHFERGFLFTIRELITNPGQNVRTYLTENRSRQVKPIIFIIVTSLIYSVSVSFFHFEDGYVGYSDTEETSRSAIFKWIQAHYGYANIIMGLFIALWTKLFFRKYPFNIFEILILLCFVMGMGMVILSLFGVIEGLTQLKVVQFGAIVLFIYTTWSIGQFFDKKKFVAYLKAFSAYILGMITFLLAALILGSLIDLFRN